jgi:GAF domain-containing protein
MWANRLARHIALVARADHCVLSTWDRSGDLVVTFGSFPVERGVLLEPAYELSAFPATRQVLSTHEPCLVDVEKPDADPAEVDYLRSIGHRSLVMLPLVVRGDSIGIVELTSARSRAFSERDVQLAKMLVQEAATTFDNARLYDELRQLAFREPADRAGESLAAAGPRRPCPRAHQRPQPEARRRPVHRPGPLQAPQRPLRPRQG